jgi:hypothetical protein
MVWMGGVLDLDLLQPGIFPGWLVEMSVNAYDVLGHFGGLLSFFSPTMFTPLRKL